MIFEGACYIVFSIPNRSMNLMYYYVYDTFITLVSLTHQNGWKFFHKAEEEKVN